MTVKCDYCQRNAELVNGAVLYPRRVDLFHRWFYRCKPCGAHVGTHKGTKPAQPLGRLANAELRGLKQQVHALFDPIWKSGEMERGDAYGWFASALGISKANCHIGMFSEDQCRAAIAVLQARKAA